MSDEPTERFNHTGLRVLYDGFRYDVDKIDDELGIITEHDVTLVHDRTEGELLIEQERDPGVPLDELDELHSQMLKTAQQAGSAKEYRTAEVLESFADDLQNLMEGYDD